MSQQGVWNYAAAALGLQPLTSVAPTSSAVAAHFSSIWDEELGVFLEDNLPKKARRKAKLELFSGVQLGPWTKAYIMPPDYISIVTVNELALETSGTAWDLYESDDGTKLYLRTNSDEAIINYVRRVPDVSILGPLMGKALGYQMALASVFRFKTSASAVILIQKQYEEIWLPKALAADGQESSALNRGESALMRARRFSSASVPDDPWFNWSQPA